MIRQRGNSWQVDVEVGGKRIRRSVPTEEAAIELEARLLNQGTDAEVTMVELVRRTWNRDWRHCKDGQGLVRRAEIVLTDMGWANKSVHLLQARDLEMMMDHYRAKGNTDATINRKLASITKLLSTAIEQGIIKTKPAVKQVRERNGRVRFLSQEEEQTLLQLAQEHEYIGTYHLIIFLLDTGCRVGEALKLKPCDVNKQFKSVVFVDTKNGTNRTIPLTDRALASAFGWKHLTQPKFNHQWNRLRSAMGLSQDMHMVPHILRHTCASRLVQNGVDLRVVKDWMGHKSIAMTMRYAHLRLEDLMQARDVLEGIQRAKPCDTCDVTHEEDAKKA